jgi:hypothetical protein
MVAMSLGMLFNREIILISCEAQVDHYIRLILFKEFLGLEKGMVFRFERLRMNDNSDTVYNVGGRDAISKKGFVLMLRNCW